MKIYISRDVISKYEKQIYDHSEIKLDFQSKFYF